MASVLRVPSRSRIMKKESNGGGEKVQSRPSSASSLSSKSSSSKDKVKDKGPTKDELVKANTELSTEVEELTTENQLLKSTISAVVDKLIENAKIKGVKVRADIENPNVTNIPASSLVSLTEKLTAESHKSNTMEYRMEELETRVTHLNAELAKLLRTRINVENGLDEIVNDCETVDEIKTKANHMIRDIRSMDLFTYVDSLPAVDDGRSTDNDDTSTTPSQHIITESTSGKTKPKTFPVVLTHDNLNLTPPKVKMAGDTHIKNMHKDLRQYVIQQLSLPKGNGVDWRLMGERLGIPAETINQWKRWKVEQPMYYVLQTWSQSTAATVRILHRHLVSTQMRCTLLAKRLSDFYQVD